MTTRGCLLCKAGGNLGREARDRFVFITKSVKSMKNGKDDEDDLMIISMNRNLRSRFTRVCRSCGEEGWLEFKTLFDCR